MDTSRQGGNGAASIQATDTSYFFDYAAALTSVDGFFSLSIPYTEVGFDRTTKTELGSAASTLDVDVAELTVSAANNGFAFAGSLNMLLIGDFGTSGGSAVT